MRAQTEARNLRRQRAGRNTDYLQAYRRSRRVSTPPPKKVRDADPTGPALGALVLYLLGRTLPRAERRIGWELVDRWLRQLVSAKHFRGAA